MINIKSTMALVFLMPLLVFSNESEVEFITLLKSSKSWDGSKLTSYGEGEPEVTILKVIVPPGKNVETHKHPVINAAILLRGEITVYAVTGEKIVLKAGDPIVELVDKWHYGLNSGDGTAEILVFYAGIKDKPLSIKK